jgi:hypothetical protein
MRVTDRKKWRRAKTIVAFVLALIIIACIGGLEGTEPMPNPELAMYVFPFLVALIWNITKENPY